MNVEYYKTPNPTDPTVFKYFEYLNRLDDDAKLKLVFGKPLPPELLHLLHNMRTEAVSDKLSISPKGSDFATHWSHIDGQIAVLTTLIKAIENESE